MVVTVHSYFVNVTKRLVVTVHRLYPNSSKLGYHIDNRIIYYLGRMISAQKEVEFSKSSYDDLKDIAVKDDYLRALEEQKLESYREEKYGTFLKYTDVHVVGKGNVRMT